MTANGWSQARIRALGRAAIMGYFFLLASCFALLVPVFESPDEIAHLDYINFVAHARRLTNQNVPELSVAHEGNQPPLYYILGAVVVHLIATDDTVVVVPVHNTRHGWVGGTELRVPLFDHVRHDPFPSNADRVAFYLLRLLSVVMGVGTVHYAGRLGQLFLKTPYWDLLPPLFVATLPQLVFSSATINNDNLANVLAAAALYHTFRLLHEPLATPQYVGLGLALGLGLLTKKTLLFLVPGIVLVACIVLLRHRTDRGRILLRAGVSVLIGGLLSGWLFVRSYLFYGDLLGSVMEATMFAHLATPKPFLSPYFLGHFLGRLFVPHVPGAPQPDISGSTYFLMAVVGLGLVLVLARGVFKDFRTVVVVFLGLLCVVAAVGYRSLISEVYIGVFFENLHTSFVGLFGYNAVFLPDAVYSFYGCLLGLAAVGLLVDRCKDIKVLAAGFFVLACLAGIVRFNLTYKQPAGRYLFPAVTLVAVLGACGWQALLTRLAPPRGRVVAIGALVVGFFASDAIGVVRLVRFYYDPAQYETAQASTDGTSSVFFLARARFSAYSSGYENHTASSSARPHSAKAADRAVSIALPCHVRQGRGVDPAANRNRLDGLG
jgi:4-amino-4-deoxy-L-arabinose transferase-like glycosyltransferase